MGAAVGGAVLAAGAAGYAAGTWLNENTPIQSWISKAVDTVTGSSSGAASPKTMVGSDQSGTGGFSKWGVPLF